MYPNPALAPDAVGLDEMNATIQDNVSVTSAEVLAPGNCSADIQTPAPGAAVGSNTMVLSSRLLVGATNPGWIATGGADSAVANFVNVRICNDGAPTVAPPTLSVSFFTLAP